jgi:hypothetical protein
MGDWLRALDEPLAIGLVLLAAGYLVHRLTGWPRLRRVTRGGGVVVGGRLARGVARAERRRAR